MANVNARSKRRKGKPTGRGKPARHARHRCIWCLLKKPETEFNREHVIPQAFETFEPKNLTLINAVCCDCNSFFSRELEPTLARDTLEGFQRYEHGQKPKSEFKSLGKKSVTKAQMPDGFYAGAWGYAAAGDPDLRITPFPQIGFAKSEDGPFDWYPLTELPTPEAIKTKGFIRECHLRFCECSDLEEARRMLTQKGFTAPAEITSTFDPPRGPAKVEMEFRVGSLLQRRGWAKVLFNYIAYTAGVATALQTRFHPIRDLVLRGIEPAHGYYNVDTRAIIVGDKVNNTRLLGHIVNVRSEGGLVFGTVSLYNVFRHSLILAMPPGNKIATSGHFFDLATRTIVPMLLGSPSQ
jgi:hypothetical protein